MNPAPTVSAERWSRAFGASVIAASHVLAGTRNAPGDWRSVLERERLIEQVVKEAVTQLLEYDEGRDVTLSPLAADVLRSDVLPDARWSRKQVAAACCLWLGVTPRFDLMYDRPVAALQKSA